MTQFTTGHLTARIAFQMIALQLALGITIPTPPSATGNRHMRCPLAFFFA